MQRHTAAGWDTIPAKEEVIGGKRMQPTYVNYGVVLSIDGEQIGELKSLIKDLGAKMIYQKVSSEHLTIIEKSKLNSEEKEELE